jgi:hypothetical protein
MSDYEKWQNWSKEYDSDGENVDLNIKIPLEHVNPAYLADSVDLSQVTAECGRPMTQAEFDLYRARAPTKCEILNANKNGTILEKCS